MSGSYGGQGFGGFGAGGSGDGRGGFGGFGGAGMNDLFDALGQLKQNFEQGVGATFAHKSGGRMGRGDVRVAILALLAESPMHGYQIIQQIEERSGGSWKPSPGSVYPTLQLLTDEGMVEVQEEGGRKTYSITEAGRAEASDRPAPWRTPEAASGSADTGDSRADGPGFGALPKAGAGLAQAAMQVGRIGSPEQVQRAVDIIDEARRKLYAILAEG